MKRIETPHHVVLSRKRLIAECERKRRATPPPLCVVANSFAASSTTAWSQPVAV